MLSGLSRFGFRSPNHSADEVHGDGVERSTVLVAGLDCRDLRGLAKLAGDAPLRNLLAASLNLLVLCGALGFGALSSCLVFGVVGVDALCDGSELGVERERVEVFAGAGGEAQDAPPAASFVSTSPTTPAATIGPDSGSPRRNRARSSASARASSPPSSEPAASARRMTSGLNGLPPFARCKFGLDGDHFGPPVRLEPLRGNTAAGHELRALAHRHEHGLVEVPGLAGFLLTNRLNARRLVRASLGFLLQKLRRNLVRRCRRTGALHARWAYRSWISGCR
jgi:hypothetical protein